MLIPILSALLLTLINTAQASDNNRILTLPTFAPLFTTVNGQEVPARIEYSSITGTFGSSADYTTYRDSRIPTPNNGNNIPGDDNIQTQAIAVHPYHSMTLTAGTMTAAAMHQLVPQRTPTPPIEQNGALRIPSNVSSRAMTPTLDNNQYDSTLRQNSSPLYSSNTGSNLDSSLIRSIVQTTSSAVSTSSTPYSQQDLSNRTE